MNDRIKLLAEKAGMILGDAGEFDMAKFMPKEVKFAELIVRECAEVIFETPVKYTEIDIMHIIRDRVKEHFGL